MTDYDDSPTNIQGPPPPPGQPPLDKDQKAAIAAALAGTAALGGAAYGMAQFLDDSDPEPDPHQEAHRTHDVKNDLLPINPVSHVVNPPVDPLPPVVPHPPVDLNALTFEDAFREARQDMGAGHHFEWHGQLYNTYHQDEWDKMSPREHQDFLATVYGDDMPDAHHGSGELGGHHADVMAHNSALPPLVPPPIDDPNVTVDPSTPGHLAQNTDDHANVIVEQPAAGGERDADMFTNHVDIAMAELDGHHVEVFDIDNDDHPDAVRLDDSHVVMIDTNHDHILDTSATYDPESHRLSDFHDLDQHYTIDGSMDVLHHSDTSLAGSNDLGPDFNNTADITDFV